MTYLPVEKVFRVGIEHGAGYVGRELIGLLQQHPALMLATVGSRSMAGKMLSASHPALRGTTDLEFTASILPTSGDPDSGHPDSNHPDSNHPDSSRPDIDDLDIIVLCAAHGDGASQVATLLEHGFEGVIVDMSCDLRSGSVAAFEDRFSRPHPAANLLQEAVYGLPEIHTVEQGTRLIANPGCFATGIILALNPLNHIKLDGPVAVTAITGASGSGARHQAATHFPDRSGNMRAYNVFEHQHAREVNEHLDGDIAFSFVPVSGPWTRGIWGTALVNLSNSVSPEDVVAAFDHAYSGCPFVRLHKNSLPELHYSVGTPFCDIGIIQSGSQLVIGFALDNLLKGAASQAIQNINCAMGWDEKTGLIGSVASLAIATEEATL